MKTFRFILILLIAAAAFSLVACNRGNSRNSGAEPTEAELQAALEAIQQMVGGVGANAPTTTAPASTSAPAPTTAPVNGPSTWTAVEGSTFDKSDIYSIAYGNNRFVAVGYQGKIAYSNDGISWTAVSDSKFPSTESTGSNFAFQIRTIAYGTAGNAGGRFVAGGYEGKMAYSDNGTSWTAVSSTNSPFREFPSSAPSHMETTGLSPWTAAILRIPITAQAGQP